MHLHLPYLLQGSDDTVHFPTEYVRKGDDGTATVDDLITQLAQQANKPFWCVVKAAEAPDHAHTVQDQRKDLRDVLQKANRSPEKQACPGQVTCLVLQLWYAYTACTLHEDPKQLVQGNSASAEC